MNRQFIDLLSRFPDMLDAFNRLPEYDKATLCNGVRECFVSPEEEQALAVARHAGFFLMKGDESNP